MQLDADGQQLRRVRLPGYMRPEHAVESLTITGTFIVSHYSTQLMQWQVSEVNTAGEVLRHFSGSLGDTPHIAVDIQHIAVDSQGNIFAAEFDNRRILLLDARLALRRVIIDKHQLKNKQPRHLCYNEQSAQLTVGFYDYVSKGRIVSHGVAVFDVLQ